MLSFHNLDRLSPYHHYLKSILGQKKFFFVWGIIRDLLLNRETNLDDIDITLASNPSDIKSIIHSSKVSDFSFFDTEKYGTMTIIPKDQDNSKTQYEITPFRTETTYSDWRHPDEVQRSESLLDDSQRRDFTINCIYYTRVAEVDSSKDRMHYATMPLWNHETLTKSLEKDGRYYDTDSCTLVIQNHNLIQKISGTTPYDSFSKEDISWPIVHLILDPHHGIQDIINKKIRAVGIADRRFQEDSLRIIRALRFAIALEFDIEKNTWNSLQKNAHLIRQVAKERIKQECDKVFGGNNPFGFVALLDAANILKRIFPKVYDNKWVEQPIRYHPFDVYSHTLLVLYHAQQLTTDKLLRYAALYHDVGKVEQYSSYNMKLDDEGVRDIFSSWLNHTICGPDFVKEDFKKLWCSNTEIEIIARYVRRHMKLWEILMWDPTHYKKKLRPMIAEVGPERVKNLWLLTIADRLGHYNPIQPPQIEWIYKLIDLVDEIMDEEGRFTMKQLKINGNILIQELNIPAWPQLWQLLKQAYERTLEDLTRNNKKILLDTVKQWMKN